MNRNRKMIEFDWYALRQQLRNPMVVLAIAFILWLIFPRLFSLILIGLVVLWLYSRGIIRFNSSDRFNSSNKGPGKGPGRWR